MGPLGLHCTSCQSSFQRVASRQSDFEIDIFALWTIFKCMTGPQQGDTQFWSRGLQSDVALTNATNEYPTMVVDQRHLVHKIHICRQSYSQVGSQELLQPHEMMNPITHIRFLTNTIRQFKAACLHLIQLHLLPPHISYFEEQEFR